MLENDVLVVYGTDERVEALVAGTGLRRLPVKLSHRAAWEKEAGLAVVMIHPDSSLTGRSLRQASFRTGYGVHVLGAKRRGDLIVDWLTGTLSGAGPYAMMSALFVISAGLGLVFSNTATAVLMAPVAIQAAIALGVAPHAFVMSVAIAASAAFATPVSTPVVTLVVEPGQYRFMDFVKLGAPVLVIGWLVSMIVIPWVFPF